MHIFITLFCLLCSINSPSRQNQTTAEARWVSGRGSMQGTDIDEMRKQALNRARSDALKKAGVVMKATDVLLKSESNQTLTDFFTQFAESYSLGYILDERGVKISHPIPTSDSSNDLNTVYRIEAQLEALIAIQHGEPDPGFEVRLTTNREAYEEDEPVNLTINTTRDGFLTLFSIENDSLTLLFPNSLNPNNNIKANKSFNFPPGDLFSLRLKPVAGRTKSEITFVAIISRDEVPFTQADDTRFEGNRLKLQQALLKNYAKWLYKIPADRRCSDIRAVQVYSREKPGNE